jgi:hypothetical protein
MKNDARHAPTPEEDFAMAERALDQGTLVHAAQHLASALAADPERAGHLALVDLGHENARRRPYLIRLWPAMPRAVA